MPSKPPTNIAPLRLQTPCPRCKQPSDRTCYPFCSKRCADLDLGDWFDGTYRLSGIADAVESD